MSNDSGLTLSARSWMMLLLLGLLWGGSFFFARIAVAHIPPVTLAFLRFSIAALALHIFIAGRYGIYRELRARWPAFLLLGLINNAIPHTMIFAGQTQIGAGLASILNATTPIFTVVIAHFLTTDEKLTSAKIAGTIVGLAGTILLFSPHIGDKAGAPLWAIALPLIAALSYGFAAIFSRRFKGVAPPVTAAGQLTASTIMILPVSLLVDQPWTLAMPPLPAVSAVIALALVSTAFAYILFFRLISVAGATNASLVTLLVPPSAIVLGIIFLGEHLEAAEWAGMFVIGVGLVILDGRLVRRLRQPA
ncbi:EamA family transporter [Rhizobium sp. KVB221]|uniref:EamA family transporter n=1 Tax=Rhizobium setariae TaxID=2801340 RepID=A0A937CQW1_9HYPH|nr:EamA family transporter [Rhizobium setariae]MBL0374498.1 EamA family transporter [Rhizobium setariae]